MISSLNVDMYSMSLNGSLLRGFMLTGLLRFPQSDLRQMQNMNSILVFPMETFMQGDIKSDLKKPFERALKEYEYK